MQRRQFFQSLKSKTKKLAVHNCYELNLAEISANIFIHNPKSEIILIDSNLTKFKDLEGLNFCYIDLTNTQLNEIIKKIKEVFPNYKIAILSNHYIYANVDTFILINQLKDLGQLEQKTLFAYDYEHLEVAEKHYHQQEAINKDIFISQLFEDQQITAVFAERLKNL